MRFGTLLLMLIGLAVLPGRATARDIFVDNQAGDDINDGLSRGPLGQRKGPFRTISRALRAARNGDQIHVANTGTPYRESLTLQAERHSGVETRPFVIEGNGAIIDGAESVSPNVWEPVQDEVFRFPVERKSTHVLYLAGKPAARRRAMAGSLGPPPLEPLEWCLYEGHIYFRVEPGKLPWAYDLSHTVLPVGLTLYEVRHVVIRDLVIQGFALDGVNAHDGATNTRIVGLTCRGNGRSGISIGGASRVEIEACLVGDNGEAQVRVEGFSRTRIVNCDLIDQPFAPALDKQGGQVEMEARVASGGSQADATR